MLTIRLRALVGAAIVLGAATFATSAADPGPAVAGGAKVAIIVGPVGGLTGSYRTWADEVGAAATAAGATVAKAYSPHATWPNVLAAVEGANVVVYFGHGNGYPNPYGSAELTDRTNGWGLNTATTNGDADSWSAGTLVYCGEKALLGTLTGSDGFAQRTHCTGGPIRPAPGFTMVYAQAHYTGGWGERYSPSDPMTTLHEAQERVRHYSYPMLALGASGYFATGYGDADEIVSRLLTQSSSTLGQIYAAGRGYSAAAQVHSAHPDVGGAEIRVQETVVGSLHFGQPDYWYAFAGNPNATPVAGPPAVFSDIYWSPFRADIEWVYHRGITFGCGDGRYCPTTPVAREQMASFISRALGLPAAGQDYFWDDAGNLHEPDINRLAAAGISLGCDVGRYCPSLAVNREQMASFLARALNLPATGVDYFWDDAGSLHEADINRLAAAGVTLGCGGGVYCPGEVVTREQMAAFLHRALD